MKKKISLLAVALLLATVLAAAALAACAKTETPEPTAEPVSSVTDEPEITDVPATAEPTEVPVTPEPTEPPTPKPELGENKGKPFAEDQEGVVTLFFEDFDDEDVDVLESAGALWGSEHMQLIDGKLCLAFAGGEPEDNHQSYFAFYDEDFSDFEQFELSFDYKIAYTAPQNKESPWFANIIGCFITTPEGLVATNAKDGLFIGLNNKGDFPIYGVGETGSAGGWPGGAMLFKSGREDMFNEERHVTVIQTNEKKMYLYIDGELICHLEVGETEVSLFGADGELVASKANDPLNQDGARMMIWTHCTGAIVDNYCVKAY